MNKNGTMRVRSSVLLENRVRDRETPPVLKRNDQNFEQTHRRRCRRVLERAIQEYHRLDPGGWYDMRVCTPHAHARRERDVPGPGLDVRYSERSRSVMNDYRSTDKEADDERRRRVEYDSNPVWTTCSRDSIRNGCRNNERMWIFPLHRRHDVWEWFSEHG